MYPLILSLSDKMQSIYSEKANLNKHKERLTPDKSSQDGCIMLFFSIVQRKDMPSDGTVCRGFQMGGAGSLPGEPERNAVPRTGDTMGMARAGNWLPIPTARHHIISVHTAASGGLRNFLIRHISISFPIRIQKDT